MRYKVTFKFQKMPWYSVADIEASNKAEALKSATEQMLVECGSGHQMKKPVVELTR